MLELLLPAGNLKKLKTAFHFGADAVYIGGKSFSLRAFADNFTEDEIREGVKYAHALDKKVYVTANIFAKNADLPVAKEYFEFLQDAGVDAVLISDMGMLSLCKEVAPNLAIHLSTQANTTNVQAVKFYKNLGVKRVVLARELGLKEIAEIHNAVPDMELEAFVHAVCIVGDLTPKSRARIISRGEVLSSTIICYTLNARGVRTNLVDAKKLIITDNDYLKGEPDKAAIQAAAPAEIEKAFRNVQAVITQGFVSSTADGETTVLGRGGSDYTASLLGMALGAEEVQIWTDVDGVMTADPRVVEHPVTMREIAFEEAAEMAHFGAKVLHPMTIEPAVRLGIPIYVLDSTHPDRKGTGIFGAERIPDGIKSVSSKENIQVINITGVIEHLIVFPDLVDAILAAFGKQPVTQFRQHAVGDHDILRIIDDSERFDTVLILIKIFFKILNEGFCGFF